MHVTNCQHSSFTPLYRHTYRTYQCTSGIPSLTLIYNAVQSIRKSTSVLTNTSTYAFAQQCRLTYFLLRPFLVGRRNTEYFHIPSQHFVFRRPCGLRNTEYFMKNIPTLGISIDGISMVIFIEPHYPCCHKKSTKYSK